MMTKFSLFMAAVSAFLLLSPGQMAAAHDGVRIEDAYARVIGATAKSGGVFMTLLNHSIEDDRLLSVTTDAAARTGLHSNVEDANGVMRMIEIEGGLLIEGMGTRILDRGGDHIMLFGPTRPLTQGDVINLTLTFERSGVMKIEVPVDNTREPAPAHDMSGMDHTAPATD